MQETKQFIQAEEISARLNVPRHFMGKILKKLVKSEMLSSSKGKTGGFAANERTKKVSLIELYNMTDGTGSFARCSLRLQECDVLHPCPVHEQMEGINQRLKEVLSTTTIGDLLKEDKEAFIKSIATGY